MSKRLDEMTAQDWEDAGRAFGVWAFKMVWLLVALFLAFGCGCGRHTTSVPVAIDGGQRDAATVQDAGDLSATVVDLSPSGHDCGEHNEEEEE